MAVESDCRWPWWGLVAVLACGGWARWRPGGRGAGAVRARPWGAGVVRRRAAGGGAGFALARRPERRSRALTLARATGGSGTRLGGSGVEFVTRSGRVALRWDLAAFDVSGRRLPAWLSLSGLRLLLWVAGWGARYPLRVAPLVQQAQLIPSGAAYFAGGRWRPMGTRVPSAPGTTVGLGPLLKHPPGPACARNLLARWPGHRAPE